MCFYTKQYSLNFNIFKYNKLEYNDLVFPISYPNRGISAPSCQQGSTTQAHTLQLVRVLLGA